eukprot:CAMPEP_0179186556 /NCGR_PEP_ID=MMETSP0796-20121207/92534_1 /TAXON_ID=73915 /ORGANISM="Pyrodinium bahamense, Strain pbaha01" /LENGTH=95 /DNA_ID=CAMNT_0020890557 /DNA_START=217 /DNA_END=501 /DNA_ORIENTATION=+
MSWLARIASDAYCKANPLFLTAAITISGLSRKSSEAWAKAKPFSPTAARTMLASPRSSAEAYVSAHCPRPPETRDWGEELLRPISQCRRARLEPK